MSGIVLLCMVMFSFCVSVTVVIDRIKAKKK